MSLRSVLTLRHLSFICLLVTANLGYGSALVADCSVASVMLSTRAEVGAMRSFVLLVCCLTLLLPISGLTAQPVDYYGRPLADETGPIFYHWDGQQWLKTVGFETPKVISEEEQSPPPLPQLASSDSVTTTDYTLGPWTASDPMRGSSAVAIGDVTGDGRNDVLLTTSRGSDETEYRLFVYPQLSNGELGAPVPYPYNSYADSNGIVLADLNKDQRLDVVVGHDSGITVFLGNIQNDELLPGVVVEDTRALNLSTMDVNRDGNPDIISLSHDTGASVFLGDGSGGFSAIDPLSTNVEGFNDQEVEDLNDDGVFDLAVMSGQSYDHLTVHLHDTVSSFETDLDVYYMGEMVLASGLGLGDVTGDGLNDAVISRGHNSPTHLWVMAQDQLHTLTGPTMINSYDLPGPIEVDDLNGDGLDDIAVLHEGWLSLGIYMQGTEGLEPEVLYPIPYSTHYPMQGLAIGDFSSDGCTDVAIADYWEGLVVLYGRNCNLIYKDGFE